MENVKQTRNDFIKGHEKMFTIYVHKFLKEDTKQVPQ